MAHPDLIAKARALRKSMTPQEARLWLQLRPMRAEGFPFRRQSGLFGYVLDFVCLDRRLVIEVDGSQHAQDRQSEHDFVRDKVLTRAGFNVLRFTNADVNTNLDGVVELIQRTLVERSSERAGGRAAAREASFHG